MAADDCDGVKGEEVACREVSSDQNVEQVLSKFSGALQELLG
jgi:hypothetical protein